MSTTNSTADFVAVVVRLTVVIVVTKASEFVADAFLVALVAIFVVVSVTELKCSSMLTGAFAAALGLVKVVAVDCLPDLYRVQHKIYGAVFFLFQEISFGLLLRNSLRVSVQMF